MAADVIEAEITAALASAIPDLPQSITRDTIAATVDTITIATGCITIALQASAISPDMPNPLVISWTAPSRLRKREIIATTESSTTRPIRSEARSRLLSGIAKARLWLDAIMTGQVETTVALADRERISERAARQMLSLAFLAPDIVEAAASGTLPRGFGISPLTDLPPCWDEQRRLLGIAR